MSFDPEDKGKGHVSSSTRDDEDEPRCRSIAHPTKLCSKVRKAPKMASAAKVEVRRGQKTHVCRSRPLRRSVRARLSLSTVALKLGVKEAGLARETMLLTLAYGAFRIIPNVCNKVYHTYDTKWANGHRAENNKWSNEVPYEDSLFGVLEKPLQASLAIVALARFLKYTGISKIAYSMLMDTPGCLIMDTYLVRLGYLACFVWLAFRGKTAIVNRATRKVLRKFKTNADRRTATQAVKNVGTVATTIIGVIAAISLSDILNVSITRAWAGLGFTGVAAGLAAKDTAANIIGGLLINLTKPFEVSQYISIGNVMGEVLEIGSMKTRIMTAKDRYEVVVPNSHFLNSVVTNLSTLPAQNLEAEFGVSGTSLEKMPIVCKKIYHMLLRHPLVDSESLEPYCNVGDISLFCPVISLRCILKRPCKTPAVYARTREEILFKVRDILREENVDFVYPRARP